MSIDLSYHNVKKEDNTAKKRKAQTIIGIDIGIGYK
jgi:hypothetical protein